MNFHKRYQAPSLEIWQGREDDLRFFQVIQELDLTKRIKIPSEDYKFAFLGFASDEGVKRNHGRVGAKDGPYAIKKALAGLPVHFDKSKIALFDAGTITCNDDDLESAQEALAEAVALLIKNNYFPIVLGGGHEVAYGHYLGLHQAKAQQDIAIINFDAHFDLRPLEQGKGSSGTPFKQIADLCKGQGLQFNYNCLGVNQASNTKSLFETAKELNVEFTYAKNFASANLDNFIQSNEQIYLTICLDVFSAASAPGVSAPAANGIDPREVMPLLDQLAKSKKIISLDIAEMAPNYDQDGITAKLAASLIFEFIAKFA